MSGTALLLFSFITVFFKEIEAIMGQRRAAAAAGIPVRAISYTCLILMGLVVAFALKAIGGLLIYALIVTPAAAALQLTYRLSRMFMLSAFFGAAACIIGLWFSYLWAVPPGAIIVLVSCAILATAMALSPKKATP